MSILSINESPQEPLFNSASTRSPMRVMVVDDDPFTLTIMKKRLTMGGYDFISATNGREALDLLDSFRPNLIVSDWMMPELDGRELCSCIKSDPRHRSVYFILLTAKDKYEDKIAALDTGADEYLVKPCDGRELMARLRAAERILGLQTELSQSNDRLQHALLRLNAELEATSEIQRRLLPLALPRIQGYGFAAHYQPSTECSGDFYDVLSLEDGRVGIGIGDVSGHGTPSMVAMAVTHMLIHVEDEAMGNPAQMLFNLNNRMAHHLPTDQFLTIFYGVLDPATGRLVYSSAGHNPPLLADFERKQFGFLPGCEGFPVKLIGPDMEYTNCEVQIELGQHLVLYTDGLVEARNAAGELYGAEGFQQSVSHSTPQSAQMLLDWIMADLNDYQKGRQLDDDLSMLILARYLS